MDRFGPDVDVVQQTFEDAELPEDGFALATSANKIGMFEKCKVLRAPIAAHAPKFAIRVPTTPKKVVIRPT